MKKILLAVILAVAVAGGWYAASPAWAMYQLKQAAIHGDREVLTERIDFPSIRNSLKSQAKAAMAALLPSERGSSLAALNLMVSGLIADLMVGSLVTPDGIGQMIAKGHFARPLKQQPQASNDTAAHWDIERRSFDQFRATPSGSGDGRGPTLVFRRNGLGWKMVDIVMPADPHRSWLPPLRT